MALSPSSRYKGLSVYTATDSHGVSHPAVGLRPHDASLADEPLVQHRLTATEDVESLAHRYYGSSEAWWRIADANPRRFPWDWEPGAAIRIPGSAEIGRIERTRRF